jgi:hypothetical protein
VNQDTLQAGTGTSNVPSRYEKRPGGFESRKREVVHALSVGDVLIGCRSLPRQQHGAEAGALP